MKYISAVFWIFCGMSLAACNISTPAITPTAEILASPTESTLPPMTNTASPTLTPSAPTEVIIEVPVIVATPLPTLAPDHVNPTLIVPPTETPGPCIETVKTDDTLTRILLRQPCGNAVTLDLVQAVVRINSNLNNPDILPPVGSEILIPLPTATAIPEGFEMTKTAAQQQGVEIIGGQQYAQGQEFGCYEVQEGDTLVGIMEAYDTTLEVLSQNNPNLNWFGCDFTNPSGGPNCRPNTQIGACITVPLPTGTPVPSPTPSGNETATPTPTHIPIHTFYPPEGAIARGRVQLMWVSAGILAPNEYYLIDFSDETSGIQLSFTSTDNQMALPDDIIPKDGNTHRIQWRVSVGKQNADGTYTITGGASNWRGFQWQSN